MKVCITGASGFLGGWLAKRCLQEGHEVRVLMRSPSELAETQGLSVDKVQGDILDSSSLIAAFEKQDVVFHLAGAIAYRRSARSWLEEVNVRGTRNVVETLERLQGPRLVHLSSAVTRGASFGPHPRNEDSEFNLHAFDLGYYETKKRAEDLVLESARLGRIEAFCINPSSVYGAGDARKGSRSNQLKAARGELKIYPPGGVNVVAVEDVIEGIMLALKKAKTGECYILSGENLLIKDLLFRIADFVGRTRPSIPLSFGFLRFIGSISDQVERFGIRGLPSYENAVAASLFNWFDSTKAQKDLGFTFRPASESLENSLNWMKSNGYLGT